MTVTYKEQNLVHEENLLLCSQRFSGPTMEKQWTSNVVLITSILQVPRSEIPFSATCFEVYPIHTSHSEHLHLHQSTKKGHFSNLPARELKSWNKAWPQGVVYLSSE